MYNRYTHIPWYSTAVYCLHRAATHMLYTIPTTKWCAFTRIHFELSRQQAGRLGWLGPTFCAAKRWENCLYTCTSLAVQV